MLHVLGNGKSADPSPRQPSLARRWFFQQSGMASESSVNVDESASTQAPDGRVLADHVVPSVSSNSSVVVPRKILSGSFAIFGTDIHRYTQD